MSRLGVFAVDRGIFDHPVLHDGKPFSKREAWLWLIAEAAWKERDGTGPGHTINLKRGQLSHSIRFIAKAWRWDKARVERLFARLKTEAWIETDAETGQTLITICKYAEYQRISLPTKTPAETAVETRPRHDRDKLEDIQTIQKEDLSEMQVSDRRSKGSKPQEYPKDFEAAWLAYPRDNNMSKRQALPEWKKLSVEDRAKVLPSIPRFKAFCNADPTYRPVHFVRYLKDYRFEGHYNAGDAVSTVGWEEKLAFWHATGEWATGWGPRPGDPNCEAPAGMLGANVINKRASS